MGAVLNHKGSHVMTVYVVLAYHETEKEWREICKFDNLDPAAGRAEAELNAKRITDINGVSARVDEWITHSSVVKTFRPKQDSQ